MFVRSRVSRALLALLMLVGAACGPTVPPPSVLPTSVRLNENFQVCFNDADVSSASLTGLIYPNGFEWSGWNRDFKDQRCAKLAFPSSDRFFVGVYNVKFQVGSRMYEVPVTLTEGSIPPLAKGVPVYGAGDAALIRIRVSPPSVTYGDRFVIRLDNLSPDARVQLTHMLLPDGTAVPWSHSATATQGGVAIPMFFAAKDRASLPPGNYRYKLLVNDASFEASVTLTSTRGIEVK